jgi:hypothetical protein
MPHIISIARNQPFSNGRVTHSASCSILTGILSLYTYSVVV